MPFDILLIDDDEEMCEELKDILGYYGYHVEVAYNVFTGIEQIKKGLCQLVLLDIKMPELSGKEILRFIQSNRPDLKVIILTGSPLDQVGLELMESRNSFSGSNYVMNKPFDIDQLLSKIKELLVI